MRFYKLLLFSAATTFLVYSCIPPRTIYNSGKTTPHKEVKAGFDFSGNFTSHFARNLYDNVEAIAKPLINKDSLSLDEQLIYLNKTALAYAIDPFGAGYGLYVRYGVAPGFDMGYKFSSGTHVFDGMYQFMGSKGSVSEPGEGFFNGSIGLQYSFRNYSLPDWSGLSMAQKVLDFELKRKDLLIPLIFSVAIGPEETYGSVAWGLVYSHSFISYGFNNQRIYDTISSMAPTLIEAFHNKQNYPAYGAFFNLKLGYKFIYIIPACALYYQNYRGYRMINGTDATFKGISLVPSIGFQLNPTQIPNALKKKQDPSYKK